MQVLTLLKKEWHEALKFFHRLRNSSDVNIPPNSKQCLHLRSVSHVCYCLLCQLTLQEESSWSRLWFAWLICYSWILRLLRLPKETVQESVSGSKKPTWNLDLWLEDNLRIDLSLFISLNANLTPTEIRAIGSISLALLFGAGWVANWSDSK